jgi:tape measure domain-containing protein
MDRVVTALGQIKMKGRVQGDEMLQLAEAGINANAYLEKAFHLTPQQLQKAQQAGKISAAAAIPVILAGMDAQFKGLMDKQSHTLSGSGRTSTTPCSRGS